MPRKLAEIRAYVPRKNRMVYVFNTKGEQIDYGLSKDIDAKYELGGKIRLYIAKKTIRDRKWYFSLNETITIKEHKYSFNPEIKKKFTDKQKELKKYDINYKPPTFI